MKMMILEIILDNDEEEDIALESQRTYFKSDTMKDQILEKINEFSITESEIDEHIWPKHGSEEAAMSKRIGKDAVSWFECSKREAMNYIIQTVTYNPNAEELARYVMSYLPKKKTSDQTKSRGNGKKKKKGSGFVMKQKPPCNLNRTFLRTIGKCITRTDKVLDCPFLRVGIGVEVNSTRLGVYICTAYPVLSESSRWG